MLRAVNRARLAFTLAICTLGIQPGLTQTPGPKPGAPRAPMSLGDLALASYFRNETAQLAANCLAEIQSLEDWQARRAEYRRQLQEMLGLLPWPERADLKPVVTGRIEREDFAVEKLHFQALPGLYVTANLYLPRAVTNRVPAILYACGHARVVKNGVSFGNKTAYQHHGAWFARNGYVCLVLDTLPGGEIQGLHHGTYSHRLWWWNARGYTPGGVETWCCLRALDYLVSRPEVDPERIGMTGRSGGGAYTWMVAALDDRVKVAAPVAGITDLHNHVVDGCVEGHCDCMYFVNTYRWDFPQLAALLAPRPLLIANSDKDRIFPLDGVLRVHEQVRRIYALHRATNHLGLLITEGPHDDTQDLQLPVFRWFNRFLKQQDPLIEMAAKPFFEPEQLKVFDTLPADQINTRIHETFVPHAEPDGEPILPQRQTILARLQEKSFNAWPPTDTPLHLTPAFTAQRDGLRLRAWDFTSQPHVRLRLFLLDTAAAPQPRSITLDVLDEEDWPRWLAALRTEFEPELTLELLAEANAPAADAAAFGELKNRLSLADALAFVAPRGIGPTAWTGDEKRRTQIRRRFMLLGQTLDGMRVWDIRRAVTAAHQATGAEALTLTLRARGTMGVNALYAALFEPSVRRLELARLPASHREGPDYLNVLKILDISQALELARARAEVRVD
ncbi:MAG: acetylxylan esterase [Verrucomicrobiae bacterium]|nr:acetylxylan esterase [Verrucomicrobiae bacterium]